MTTKLEFTPSVFEQQIIRLDYLLGKQVKVVDRLIAQSGSPFILRMEKERMYDLELQIQELKKYLNK